MNEKQEILLLSHLARIANALEQLAIASAPKAPNYRRTLAEFSDFDWGSIGATVTASDNDGPTSISRDGFIWTRRSPQNKFAEAIWFSRATGERDEEGNARYARLITFTAPAEAEPLPRKLADDVTQRHPPLAAVVNQTPEKVAKDLAAVGITGSQPPQPIARQTRYDATKDTRLALAKQAGKQPSDTTLLTGVVWDSTAFFVVARLWDVDTQTAKDLWRELGKDPQAAVKALDKQVF
jgi:hypothetical protein